MQTMEINPTSGPVGTQVTVSGSGFKPDLDVELFLEGVAFLKTVHTDANGYFSTKVGIPQVDVGFYELTATEVTIESPARVAVTFEVTEGRAPVTLAGVAGLLLILGFIYLASRGFQL